MFADMIPMVISILDRELPLLAPTQISSLECTHNNNNKSVIHLHYTHYCQYTEPINVNVLYIYIKKILTELLSYF